MSGALAERVFATKLENVGFIELTVVDRQPFRLADAVAYPLFTPELIDLMHRLLDDEVKEQVAVAVTLTARKPA